MSDDNVDHPSHYTQYKGLEVIDLTEQMNFNRGNAVKYIARAGFKSEETEIEDLRKAAWYVNREIFRLSGEPVMTDPQTNHTNWNPLFLWVTLLTQQRDAPTLALEDGIQNLLEILIKEYPWLADL